MQERTSVAIAKSVLLAAAFGAAGLLLVDVATQLWRDAQPQGAVPQVLFGGLVGAIAGVSILAIWRALIPTLSAMGGKDWQRSAKPSPRTSLTSPIDTLDLFRRGSAGLLLLALAATSLLAPYASESFARFSRITTILIVLILWSGGAIAFLARRRPPIPVGSSPRWDLRSRPLYARIVAAAICSAISASVVWYLYVRVAGSQRPTASFVVVGLGATLLLAIILYDLPAPSAPRSILRDAFRCEQK